MAFLNAVTELATDAGYYLLIVYAFLVVMTVIACFLIAFGIWWLTR